MRNDGTLRKKHSSLNKDAVTILNASEEFLVIVVLFLTALILYHMNFLEPYINNFVLRPFLFGLILSGAIMIISTMLFCFTSIELKKELNYVAIQILTHPIALIISFPIVIIASFTGIFSVDYGALSNREYIEQDYSLIIKGGLHNLKKKLSFLIGIICLGIFILLIAIINPVSCQSNQLLCATTGALIPPILFFLTYSLRSDVAILDNRGHIIYLIGGINKKRIKATIESLLGKS